MSITKDETLTMKGIAIILMGFLHMFSETSVARYSVDFWPFSEKIIMRVIAQGNICVAFFVFVTCYGLTKKLDTLIENNDTLGVSKSVIKRYIGLLMNFWCVFIPVIIYIVCIGKFPDVYGRGLKGIGYMLLDGVGGAHMFQTPSANYQWWYLSFAIQIIAAVPIILCLYRKVGIIFPLTAIILPRALGIVDPNIMVYLFTISLGIMLAKENFVWKEKLWRWIGLLMFMVFLFVRIKLGFVSWFIIDGLICIMIVWIIKGFLVKWKVIDNVLKLFGKHSMNIFFVQVFLWEFYMPPTYLFKLKHFLLIFVIGMLVALLFSLGLEYAKNKIHFYDLVEKLKCKVDMI